MYRPAAHIQDYELYLPAGQLGMGWWGDAWDEVKSVAKKVQANPVVRGLEKKAVDYGSKALRGAAESAVDGLADSALSAVEEKIGVGQVQSSRGAAGILQQERRSAACSRKRPQ